jgi:hypothetical protein
MKPRIRNGVAQELTNRSGQLRESQSVPPIRKFPQYYSNRQGLSPRLHEDRLGRHYAGLQRGKDAGENCQRTP